MQFDPLNFRHKVTGAEGMLIETGQTHPLAAGDALPLPVHGLPRRGHLSGNHRVNLAPDEPAQNVTVLLPRALHGGSANWRSSWRRTPPRAFPGKSRPAATYL
jgi:hypothetical protein